MSDERIIDFNEIKNRVNEKDVDKFEGYMFDLFYKMQSGNMNMSDYAREITKYMSENNISEKKLYEIQKKMMERYGFSMPDMAEGLKEMGIDPSVLNQNNYEDARKKMSFRDKYNNKIKAKAIEEYKIVNSINNIVIELEGENIVIRSEKDIDLNDNELNEFLCSYKKTVENKTLNISICKNVKKYPY